MVRFFCFFLELITDATRKILSFFVDLNHCTLSPVTGAQDMTSHYSYTLRYYLATWVISAGSQNKHCFNVKWHANLPVGGVISWCRAGCGCCWWYQDQAGIHIRRRQPGWAWWDPVRLRWREQTGVCCEYRPPTDRPSVLHKREKIHRYLRDTY